MKQSTEIDGFSVFYSDEKFAEAFPRIREILDTRAGKILGDRMDAPKRKRLIVKAEIAGIPVVLKRELFVFRFDRSIKAFLFGSDAKNIFRISTHARKRGFTKIPQTFLVAEKFSRGVLRETISVTEFLEGHALQLPLSEPTLQKVSALLAECHAHGIISGDVQTDNFIKTAEDIKLIDFRGNKVFPWLSQARDRIQLEHNLGIKNTRPGLPEKIFFFLNSLRNFSRRLRGKSPQQD